MCDDGDLKDFGKKRLTFDRFPPITISKIIIKELRNIIPIKSQCLPLHHLHNAHATHLAEGKQTNGGVQHFRRPVRLILRAHPPKLIGRLIRYRLPTL